MQKFAKNEKKEKEIEREKRQKEHVNKDEQNWCILDTKGKVELDVVELWVI